jgi:hypothetical protein
LQYRENLFTAEKSFLTAEYAESAEYSVALSTAWR